ncbi:MAG: efflux RND transporter periplasmic adaptor subunit [Bryobacteraceae bacterium]
MHKHYARTLIGFACCLSVSCSSAPEKVVHAQKAVAAKVENRVTEADLTRIKLSPQAEQRLGIEMAEAVEAQVADSSEIAGEILLIPGKALIATAPVAGTVQVVRPNLTAGQSVRKGEALFRLTPLLGPQRDLRTTYEADVQSAKVRLEMATQQLQRTRQLLRDLAGSQKSVEAAEQEFGQAKAASEAAIERLERLKTHPLEADVDLLIPAPAAGVVRQIQAAENQTVASGAALVEVADLSRVWLRVPVYAGDVDVLAKQSAVRVRNVDGQGVVRQATRVTAPPTADPLGMTADLYFELGNQDGQLRPGQRMTVMLPTRLSGRHGIAVPSSAVLYDIHGGTWIYVMGAPQEYRRQRVEILQTEGANVILARGPNPGAKVVAAGAAELFGTEFGAGK